MENSNFPKAVFLVSTFELCREPPKSLTEQSWVEVEPKKNGNQTVWHSHTKRLNRQLLLFFSFFFLFPVTGFEKRDSETKRLKLTLTRFVCFFFFVLRTNAVCLVHQNWIPRLFSDIDRMLYRPLRWTKTIK